MHVRFSSRKMCAKKHCCNQTWPQSETAHCSSAFRQAATTTSTTQGEAENDSGPAPGEGGGFFFGQKIVLDARASGESQYEQSGHF